MTTELTMPTTWLPDPSHYPEQMTPLSATTWFEAIGTGLHEAMRQLRGPFGGFEARTELGWAYEGQLDVEWEPDDGGVSEAALSVRERWEREQLPRARAITKEISRIRPERPTPEEAERELDRMWSLMLEQWTIHFLAVVPAQVALELFHAAHAEALGESTPIAPYLLLGASNESTSADAELWRLAGMANDLGIADVLREFPPGSVAGRLRQMGRGRRFLYELDGYLLRYGGRARWHELSLPREAEDPRMTIESVRLFLEGGTAPRTARGHDSARLEKQTVARAPSLAPLLEVAKAAYDLKESHVYHIDYPGLLAVREALLGFGRRLTAQGTLRDVDDVWMLTRPELREALVSHKPILLQELIQERRREMARGLAEGMRPFLGEPPEEGPRHAVLEKFYGRGVMAGGKVVVGTGASPGTAEGTARVVSGPQDFARVRAGDILLTTTTTPAWTPLFPSLSGLVTETGGILCHAAIVAREYGLPTVVGAEGATRLIPDGARIRIDGTTGSIEVLATGAA